MIQSEAFREELEIADVGYPAVAPRTPAAPAPRTPPAPPDPCTPAPNSAVDPVSGCVEPCETNLATQHLIAAWSSDLA